jgi:hypothetical protein
MKPIQRFSSKNSQAMPAAMVASTMINMLNLMLKRNFFTIVPPKNL